MGLQVTKKDVAWNYIAQFFNLGAGVLILPLILNRLPANEVGLNYLMLSVATLVSLTDFGFNGQFGRNVSYVFSGAQKLKKEGLDIEHVGNDINYHLLSVVIETAKFIYKRISFIALILMLTVGTVYIHHATEGFSTVDNTLLIWIVFSFSTYFQLYFKYYNALLTGSAQIMEQNISIIINKLVYILVSVVLLLLHCGLFSIVIAHFVSPFAGRFYSYKTFYNSNGLKNKLNREKPIKEEIKDTYRILWFNAKKMGLVFLGAYGVNSSASFILGIFLPLAEIASYGLMVQLFQIVTSLSNGIFSSYLPIIYKLRIEDNHDGLVKLFSFSNFISTLIGIGGGFAIVILAPPFLDLIKSNSILPSLVVMLVYFFNQVLENFHTICSNMIVSKNEVPIVKASIISGTLMVAGYFIVLQFTTTGILGIVLVQLIVQSAYNHWKWPIWILHDLKISLYELYVEGFKESLSRLNKSLIN